MFLRSEVYICSEPDVSGAPHSPAGGVALHSGRASCANQSREVREENYQIKTWSTLFRLQWFGLWYEIYFYYVTKLWKRILKNIFDSISKFPFMLECSIVSRNSFKWQKWIINVDIQFLKGLSSKHNNMIFLTKA